MTASVSQVFMKIYYTGNRQMCFLFASLFLIPPVIAQDYQRKLDWELKAKTFTLGEKAITQPTFSGAVHFQEFGLLPFYTERISLNVAGFFLKGKIEI